MKTTYEFEVREYSKDLPDNKPYKVIGIFSKLDEPGRIIDAWGSNTCQVTHEDLEERDPFFFIQVIEYRDGEHINDQYWIDLDAA